VGGQTRLLGRRRELLLRLLLSGMGILLVLLLLRGSGV